jgi:L-2,4-diaminobutyrate decarboxylase
MDRALQQLLADLEDDTASDAAHAFARLVVDYFADTRTGLGRVSTAHTPAEIAARFAEPLPPHGQPLADVLARLERDVLPDSNHLTHPRSMGHQVSAPLPAAVWTEALTAALNQSGAVWEMSPVGTILETQVVRWLCDLVGFGPHAGGTFTSGGTEATFAGLLAARQAALPDAWARGVGADPPVVVCGEHAHYGVARAVGELGLGTDHTVVVPSRDFRMDVAALEGTFDRLTADGRRLMAVVATAGTTATGSFDDIETIGRLCEERGLWLHVDGAHGASALLSTADRRRVAGIHRARSIAWDPHKMLLLPLTASVVLVREERDLEAAFSQRAPYLFHASAGERSWDQGLRSFTCSRRVDALKVWVAIQRYGAAGLGALYDHLCAAARELHRAVVARPDFQAVHAPEGNILCFRYVGDGGRTDAQLDALNLDVRTAYNRGGDGWITSTVLGGRRMLRATLMNPRTTPGDIARVLDGLASLAGELRREQERL